MLHEQQSVFRSAIDVPLPESSFVIAARDAANRTSAGLRSIQGTDQDPVSIALAGILLNRSITAVFQPIINFNNGEIVGYEGLARGPVHSCLHSPKDLFKAACDHNLRPELEKLCREVVLKTFSELALPGNIFINISPDCLIEAEKNLPEYLDSLRRLSIRPERIVLELTENQAIPDFDQMREVVRNCRAHGFQIALDDMGEGFSSLRLWSEIKPDFVKIDMHFVQGINRDPMKLQIVQAIQQISAKSGTLTIAEGIETRDELKLVQELGIDFGQGYYIARPASQPVATIAVDTIESLKPYTPHFQPMSSKPLNISTALKLLRNVPVLSPKAKTNEVYDIFISDPRLEVLPVVENDVPIGIINRFQFIDRLARPYQRELYGTRSCTFFMTPDPLVVDQSTTLQQLSLTIVAAEIHHLASGFAITDQGQYIGVGTSQDVMREITQMQIHAARYANPLTQLPGNVPINEEIERLVLAGTEFHICYCDVDSFKPFNDVYGYRRGDDVIQLTGRVLANHCDPGVDFLGHIGGDDFIVLFQSPDWESRCRKILQTFSETVPGFYTEEDRAQGGYISEDRRGKKIFHSLVTLSLGVVHVHAGRNYSSYQISAAAAEAKRQAKAIQGNSLFVERRDIRLV